MEVCCWRIIEQRVFFPASHVWLAEGADININHRLYMQNWYETSKYHDLCILIQRIGIVMITQRMEWAMLFFKQAHFKMIELWNKSKHGWVMRIFFFSWDFPSIKKRDTFEVGDWWHNHSVIHLSIMGSPIFSARHPVNLQTRPSLCIGMHKPSHTIKLILWSSQKLAKNIDSHCTHIHYIIHWLNSYAWWLNLCLLLWIPIFGDVTGPPARRLPTSAT
jgi:hypothetical protein